MSIEELYKLLLSSRPSKKIRSNEKELFELIPELEVCKGFNQNSEWHTYDVYEHILHVIDYVPADLTLRLTALFHDIGKPLTYTEDDKGIGHFYGHWDKSKEIFEAFAKKYDIDQDSKELISNLIYYHDINVSKLDDEQIETMIKVLGIDGIKKLYQIKRADLLAQSVKYHYILEDYDKQKQKILSKYKKDLS